jgi:hypothetical protein
MTTRNVVPYNVRRKMKALALKHVRAVLVTAGVTQRQPRLDDVFTFADGKYRVSQLALRFLARKRDELYAEAVQRCEEDQSL